MKKKLCKVVVVSKLICTFALAFKTKAVGWLPEWPNGADCKSAGDAFGGSNPSPPTEYERGVSTMLIHLFCI